MGADIYVVSVDIVGILYFQYTVQLNFFTAKKSTRHSKDITYLELRASTDSHNMLNWKYLIEKNPLSCKWKVNMKWIKVVSALCTAKLLLIQRDRQYFQLIFTISNNGEI